ncbi:MAG: glutamate 5-kinase [Haliscomenobacter sp.]|uniref:glutamate 5-kinase n=1 Tax=Haliscomenobacter sp. TaxID=2717303 RepID=UPI0029B66091|nr:glutamate 5-kinase [Haliscomenobacter sp.]MDX2069996.1 glutamate 5-kinase [Haliscomenobacter sp.]
MKRIAIKIGTNVLSLTNGKLDMDSIARLVAQVAYLKQVGKEIIIVTSGAVGAGKGVLSLPQNLDKVTQRQVLSAVGQPHLMKVYIDLFREYNLHCAQVLTTKEDFRDRRHYINMKNCFLALLRDKIIPIVNENDVVSIGELMFTDNDELAGMMASMIGADTLIYLSSVDGIYNSLPEQAIGKVISKINVDDYQISNFITSEKSSFGRGGMMTKYRFACKSAKVGIDTYIANGKTPNIITDVVSGIEVGTRFIASNPLKSSKKWVAWQNRNFKGSITINQGAVDAITNSVCSLLPVGIIEVSGEFEKGDLLAIINEQKETIGIGVAMYNYLIARSNMGKKRAKALIHYDYLYIGPL